MHPMMFRCCLYTLLIPQPFCPHEIIYRQHAHGDGMYLLLNGDARAYYEKTDAEEVVTVYTKLHDGMCLDIEV